MSTVLQPGLGPILGEHYLPARASEVRWGWLPNQDSQPVLEVAPGQTVTIDTVSHEGLLYDQGRDPAAYLAQWGVTEVLEDAIEIAASDIVNDAASGPHVVCGPIAVAGAEVGDVLRVESELLSKKQSQSRPEMGSFKSAVRVYNQDDVMVMSMKSIGLIRVRGN